MSKYRTAMGKSLDMAILRSRNGGVRAVGNMNVDAAGNTLDSHNEVISDASKRVSQIYGKTTVNPGAVVKNTAMPPKSPLQKKMEMEGREFQPSPPPVATTQPAAPAPSPRSAGQQRQQPKPDIGHSQTPVNVVDDGPTSSELEEWDEELPVKTEPQAQPKSRRAGAPKN